MFILTGKLPFAFLFIFLYLVNSITLAQPNFISYDCFNDVGNYTRNSVYEISLDSTLSRVLSTIPDTGFVNSYTPTGGDFAVYTVALCRGDVNLDACRSCLNDSVVKLREICPTQKQAIGYYDYCTLNYYEAFLGNTVNYAVFLLNTQNASDVDRFNAALFHLLKNVTDEASGGGSLRKFATGNTRGPGVTRIYALAQCTPDLTQHQCKQCLESAISYFTNRFSGKIGGRTLAPTCNFRYETYQFFNESTLSIPPPPLPSPRQPPPPNVQDLLPANEVNMINAATMRDDMRAQVNLRTERLIEVSRLSSDEEMAVQDVFDAMHDVQLIERRLVESLAMVVGDFQRLITLKKETIQLLEKYE